MKESKYNLGINNFWWNFAHYTCKFALGLKYKIHLEGKENIPESGSAIILPKHQSESDIPLTTVLIKEAVNRKPYFIMKYELVDKLIEKEPENYFVRNIIKGVNKFIGYVLLKSGGIPVNRENTRESITELRYAKKKVSDGELLVLYPEGHIVEGKVGEGKVEAIRLWQKQEIPFIPVGLEYRKDSGEVFIRAGKPISFEERKNLPAQELTEIVMNEIAKLSGMG